MSKINFSRYLVIKNQDIKKYLSEQDHKLFLSLVAKVTDGRALDGKKSKQYAVTSSNSAYFPEVCKAIEQEIGYRKQFDQFRAGFIGVMVNKYEVSEEVANAEFKGWLDVIDATEEEFSWESGRSAAEEAVSYWED
ncbi:TPA: hypothetical protein ACX6NV_000551 [Photobacterium damselae]